jgi:hypothetical protein
MPETVTEADVTGNGSRGMVRLRGHLSRVRLVATSNGQVIKTIDDFVFSLFALLLDPKARHYPHHHLLEAVVYTKLMFSHSLLYCLLMVAFHYGHQCYHSH